MSEAELIEGIKTAANLLKMARNVYQDRLVADTETRAGELENIFSRYRHLKEVVDLSLNHAKPREQAQIIRLSLATIDEHDEGMKTYALMTYPPKSPMDDDSTQHLQ